MFWGKNPVPNWEIIESGDLPNSTLDWKFEDKPNPDPATQLIREMPKGPEKPAVTEQAIQN